MKKIVTLMIVLALLLQAGCTPAPAAPEPAEPAEEPSAAGGMLIENGLAQQIAAYTDPMDLSYTNEGSEPIEAGEWYDYTIWLQPNYYTVQPGHRLEVYVLPFCGFSSSDLSVAIYTPEELEGFGIDPKGLVPFSQDYSFTVDCGTSSVSIPVTSK